MARRARWRPPRSHLQRSSAKVLSRPDASLRRPGDGSPRRDRRGFRGWRWCDGPGRNADRAAGRQVAPSAHVDRGARQVVLERPRDDVAVLRVKGLAAYSLPRANRITIQPILGAGRKLAQRNLEGGRGGCGRDADAIPMIALEEEDGDVEPGAVHDS